MVAAISPSRNSFFPFLQDRLQELVLALKIPIKSTLGKLDRVCDVLYCRALEPFVKE